MLLQVSSVYVRSVQVTSGYDMLVHVSSVCQFRFGCVMLVHVRSG